MISSNIVGSSMENWRSVDHEKMTSPHIPNRELTFSDVSFMDPNGRVFQWKGEIYRGINEEHRDFYRDFLKTTVFKNLSYQRKVIETNSTEYKTDNFETVLHHRKIETTTYCFEWSAEMLQDAAVLTLDICEQLLDSGYILQDAYPWNVLFEGTNPVFIDFTSIVKPNPQHIWIPYQQFCNFFYHPLLLYSKGYHTVTRKLLSNYLDGVQGKDVQSIFSAFEKMTSPGYFTRITLPSQLSKFLSTSDYEKKLNSYTKKFEIKESVRKNFFDKLKKTIESIDVRVSRTIWENYYSETKQDVLVKKKAVFQKILEQIKPKKVLDIGCNAGEFSVLAAESGAPVVAFDMDESCVSNLYRVSKARNLNIIPLIMDVLNPTPDFGWCGRQFTAAATRFKSDLVCMFAVMHHLIFTKGQDFQRVIETVKSFQSDCALIEFIAINDEMVSIIRRRINFDDSWSTLR